MNEETQDILFDLLTKKAIYGLDEAEQVQLDELDPGTADLEFESLEITAAAIGMVGIEAEPLPAHLRNKIAASALQFVARDVADDRTLEMAAPWPPAETRVAAAHAEAERDSNRGSSWFGWFGWAAAAAACIALAVNIWITSNRPVDVARVDPPVKIDVPPVLSSAQMRDQLMQAATDTIKVAWTAGNVKEIAQQIAGDVVWSDEKQAGYMTLRGLPANDTAKETYQLWIFDKTQDAATPIDGGTFDVKSNGEVVVPINAKLKAQGPQMFAITIEKPGGVVVSKRGRIAALAKVETKTSPNT